MNIDLKFYWKLLLRRLPAMTALFLTFAVVGLIVAMKLPITYKASARLIVEEPQISNVSAVKDISAGQTLDIITQKLITRANLIDIAHNRNVFPDAARMNPDEIFGNMRAATKIASNSPRNGATLMTIEFKGAKPETVAAVVNDLVTLVLDENTRLRTGRAVEAVDFFQQEIDRLNAEMSKQSALILDFKQKNADALPESLDYRLARRDQIQERITRIERDIERLKTQRERIVSVFETTGQVQASELTPRTPEEQQLEAARNELSSALAIYSESHPRIRVLKSRIASLEAAVAARTGTAAPLPDAVDQTTAMFNLTVAQIDAQLQPLADELRDSEAELTQLQDSINRTAPNQVALATLERDMDNLRIQYNAAAQRSNVAAMGERIELTARGQKITVIENASVPSKPASPNRPKIISAGIGLGLAAAAGLFLLLEVMNRSVRRPAEITLALGITPIGTIPYMETERHKWTRRSMQVAAMVVVVIGIPAVLWAIDTFYLPLDLVFEKVMDKVGLG